MPPDQNRRSQRVFDIIGEDYPLQDFRRIWLDSYGVTAYCRRIGDIFLAPSSAEGLFGFVTIYVVGRFGRVGLAGSRETPRLLVGRAPPDPSSKKGLVIR